MQIGIFRDDQPDAEIGIPGERLFTGKANHLVLGTGLGDLSLPEQVTSLDRQFGDDVLHLLVFPPTAKIIRIRYSVDPQLSISWAANDGEQQFVSQSILKMWALGLAMEPGGRFLSRFDPAVQGPFYIIMKGE